MRIIELDIQKNVRDLGGYQTDSGKKVKFGRVYRGGLLAKVSDEDVKKINALKLTDIIDFRSPIEFNGYPDYRFLGVKYHNFPTMSDDDKEDLRKKYKNEDSNLLWFLGDRRDGHQHMKNVYAESLTTPQGIEAYRNFFKVLTSDENRVVYFHCSQGKDRAGLGAYLFLAALGVSKEDMVNDYLESNKAMKLKIDRFVVDLKDKDFFDKEYEHALRDVFAAKEDYIEHAIEVVSKECGSLLNYIKTVLNVDVEKLRKIYLE